MIRILLAACLLPGFLRAQAPLKLLVNEKKTYQVLHDFGASDAWACQFAGLWPDEQRNQLADWLFSTDTTASGQPKGIGLTMWRFNLGAGSTQQGRESGIRDEWRRAESLLDSNGTYDWRRQAGQQWFLQAAKRRGVPYFLAFFNSPPIHLTKNHKAFADKGLCNIDSAQYNAMAVYAVDALEGLHKTTGVSFDFMAPVNEPQWDWSDGGQEGSPFLNREISGLVKAFAAQLKARRVSTKIIVPEAGHIKYLLEDSDKPGRGNQVNDLFTPGANYIGNLPQVAKVAAAHSYFSTAPYDKGVALRKQVAERVSAIKGLAFWQSEYCILGDNEGEINGSRRDTGITSALYLARTVHTDLVAGNATAWQWWLAISPYDYKDGLIYIEKSKTGGWLQDSKMLWAFGNYSRFVRPGMQRVEATITGAGDKLLVSAWKDKKTKQTVAVIVNLEKSAATIDAGTRVTTYTTSAGQRLAKAVVNGPVQIQPESIVTLLLDNSKIAR